MNERKNKLYRIRAGGRARERERDKLYSTGNVENPSGTLKDCAERRRKTRVKLEIVLELFCSVCCGVREIVLVVEAKITNQKAFKYSVRESTENKWKLSISISLVYFV